MLAAPTLNSHGPNNNLNHFASNNASASNPASPTFAQSPPHSLNGPALASFNSITPAASSTSLNSSRQQLGSSSSGSSSAMSSIMDEHDPARTGKSYLEFIHGWTDDQVARWLTETHVPQYEPLFRQNDIRGTVLLDVDQTALREMGLRSVGDRVKIVVAIKNLRQRCVAQAFNERAHSRIQQQQHLINRGVPSPTTSVTSAGPIAPPNGLLASRKVGSNGRISGRIPPPLHLSNSNTAPSSLSTPTADSAQSYPSSASSLGRSNSLAARPTGQPPQTLAAARAASPGIHRLGTSPPNSSSGAHLSRAPSISTTAASPTSSRSVSGTTTGFGHSASSDRLSSSAGSSNSSYHLRTASASPAPSSVDRSRGVSPISAGPRPSQAGQPLPSPQHRKTPSANYPRPNFGGSSASSPTQEGFSIATYGRNSPNPMGSASTPKLLPSLSIAAGASGISAAASILSPTFSEGGSNLGRSGSLSARPTTPASAGGLHSSQSASTLDAVMRKAVKFIGDDGVSKMIAVADCRDGREVLMRVVKKFLPVSASTTNSTAMTSGHLGSPLVDGVELEDWEVYAIANDGSTRLLNEADLFSICRDGNAPERQRGLAVRNARQAMLDQSVKGKRDRKLQWVFGESNTPESNRPGGVSSSPTSPGYLTSEIPWTSVEPPTPASPSSPPPPQTPEGRPRSSSARSDTLSLANKKTTNRASVVSVMSGLGAEPESPSSQPGGVKSSPTPSGTGGGLLSQGRKLRSFFGQRPPSELIATHLTEYFPRAEKNKLLSKQVRQSMRKSMIRRDSAASFGALPPIPSGAESEGGGTSWERMPNDRASLISGYSGSSGGSGNANSGGASTDGSDPSNIVAPGMNRRVSNESGQAVSIAPALLEPMDETAEARDRKFTEDDAKSVMTRPALMDRRSSRLSVASSRFSGYERRRSRGGADSDSGSVLTVDEVTAELETRRASMMSYADSDESDVSGELVPGGGMRPPSIALSTEEEAEEEDDFDDEEEEGDSEDEEEDGDDVLSDAASSKPALKWIKGALIGAGSFGSVYLGMNPMSGMLMAVKQVELPTGKSHNEERKKSMLEALEREIELLKDLRHENIVQYLDSSTDSTHLNIFLEYVPGGSVAALLSNYGAFEEALVSKFVRQILTGLDYLHEREIIHRDIKGANILVDNKGGIKISDFGISKKVEDNLLSGAKVHRPSLQGSVYWMAPEVVKQTSYTSKADIWSLGCLVVEMLTGAHPWANLTQMQAIFRIGSSVSPTIPDDISNEAENFLDQTFEIDHEARPSARDLLVHAFIKDPDSLMTSQQTPTRATFSQQAAAKDS